MLIINVEVSILGMELIKNFSFIGVGDICWVLLWVVRVIGIKYRVKNRVIIMRVFKFSLGWSINMIWFNVILV